MSQLDHPPWYEPGDIEQSLRSAFQRSNTTTDDIINVLAEHELNASSDQILPMIETAREQLTEQAEVPTLSTPSPDEPREYQTRFLDLTDLEYLGPQDAAYCIGAMLARLDGNFRVPEAVDNEAADIVWIRSGTTVGLWLEWRPDGRPVERSEIQSVADDSGQAGLDYDVSETAIVSNAGFTDGARESTSEHDIYFCGPDHLSRWCRAAQLPNAVAGEILRGDNKQSGEIDTILEQLPPLPSSIPAHDPLQPVEKTEWETSTLDREMQTAATEAGTTETETPTQDDRTGPEAASDSGQQGVLYADPAEDGDFGAFARFTDGLADDEDS